MVIGTGRLSWDRSERVSDRYGTVQLFDGDAEVTPDLAFVRATVPARGHLIAKVLYTRKSEHVGDLFRGIFPSTPDVGEIIDLGEGTLFSEGNSVGLFPDDRRESDWLDPKKLYRAHDQDVMLIFEPTLCGKPVDGATCPLPVGHKDICTPF